MITTDQVGDPPVLFQWLQSKINQPWSEDVRCIGQMDGPRIVAVASFNGWRGDWAFINLATDGILTRQVVRAVAGYAFRDCNLQTLYAIVSADNHRVHRLLKQLRFKFSNKLGGNDELFFAEAVDCQRLLR